MKFWDSKGDRNRADGEMGIEGNERRECTFFSFNTNTNMSGLDHADIITTVSNTCYLLAGCFLDELNNLGFLGGGATTADDGRSMLGLLEELALDFRIIQAMLQGGSVNNHYRVCLFGELSQSGGNILQIRAFQMVDCLVPRYQLGADSYAGCGFPFIPGKHPRLYA